ncbi:MAG: hypothetical protein Kapaf2KO_23460 [Candidatus Kapaibacteriales bacterium]
MNNKKITITAIAILLSALTIFLLPDIAEARRGGRSFGGSRRSFSRKSTKPKSSFGKKSSRTRSSRANTKPKSPTQRLSSFGGKKMTSAAASKKYGTPRKTVTKQMASPNGTGMSNYRFNSYGGFGSNFMMGYMLGSIPWYWSTPFHGAYYYNKPSYVTNSDGSVDVYPGSFSWGKLFMGIIIIGGIVFLVYRVIRGRKRNSIAAASSSGSFG